MHVVGILLLVIVGLGMVDGDNPLGWFVILAGLALWGVGGKKWQAKRDDLAAVFFGLGILCGAGILAIEAFKFVTSH